MSRGDSGYMSSEDNIDIFEKLKEKLKQIEELRKVQNQEPSFVDQKDGFKDTRHTPRLVDNHNNNALPRNKLPPYTSPKMPPLEISETHQNNQSHIFYPPSEQLQSAPSSPPLLPPSKHPVSGSATPIHRGAALSTYNVNKVRQQSVPSSPPLLPLPRHPISGSTTPIYRETASSTPGAYKARQQSVSLTSDIHKMRQQSVPSSPPLSPRSRPPLPILVSGSTTLIHRKAASQGGIHISASDIYGMRQQSAPTSPPLLPLPRPLFSISKSGSATPIHQKTSSLGGNDVLSTPDIYRMRQKSAPSSPPLLPLPRPPLAISKSRSATPIHQKTSSLGGNNVLSTSDIHRMRQQSAPCSPPLSPLSRPPLPISVSGSTTPIHRKTASQGGNHVLSTSDVYRMRQQPVPTSPPLLPLPRQPRSMPVSGSATPIHQVTACNRITSTPDACDTKQTLLNHRDMIFKKALPPPPPPSPPLNLFDTPDEPSSPLSPSEEVPLSPFDFRDLIEQYYEELDEVDASEEKKLLEEMAAKSRKREAAVKEIVTTERTYVDGLNKCVELFLKPLRDSCQKSNNRHTLLSAKPFVTLDEISSIFGNIEMILSLHQQLLKSLEERYSKWSPTNLIGDIFLQNAPFLKMYTVYVKNFPHAVELMERLQKGSKDFRKFMQSIQGKAELGGLSFNSFLSLPIQRIPRYKLLLEALLKHTDESHPDYPNLENCVKQITVIADEVNEKIKDGENQNKVLEIQTKVEKCPIIVKPARRFIHEGDLHKASYKHTAKKISYFVSLSETLTHYLFNDLLVYCNNVQGRIIFKEQIDLNYASVVNIEDKFADIPFCFKIVVKTKTEEKHHVVRASDECTKLDWMSKLEDAIRALKDGNIDGRRLIPIRQIPQDSLMTIENGLYTPNTVANFI